MAWLIALLLFLILAALLWIVWLISVATGHIRMAHNQILFQRTEFAYVHGIDIGPTHDSSRSHLALILKLLSKTPADTQMILDEQRAAREMHQFMREDEKKRFAETLKEFEERYPKKRAYREAKAFHRELYR